MKQPKQKKAKMSDVHFEKSYLEFSDESKKSHKFYEVTIQENQVTFRFGRIGDNGQIKKETYESYEEAKTEVGKKIKEKLKKGYKFAVLGATEKKPIEKKYRPTFEEQLQNLTDCGISLLPKFETEILFEEYSKEDFEREPYELLVTTLGSDVELENGEWSVLSNDISLFDTECIEDNGDYLRIAELMRNLADGDLPLQNIVDFVDVDEETAWLEFELDERKYHWDLKVDNDWVDTDIFEMFGKLLQKRNPNKNYTYFDFGGQDFLLGCCTPEQLTKIRDITGMNITWINEPAT